MPVTFVSFDPETGTLVNTAGVNGESGQCARLSGRMLSTTTPKAVLNYGNSGADKLEISANGGDGQQIDLKALVVNVPVKLTISGQDVKTLISNAVQAGLERIYGTEREIEVTEVEQDEGNPSRFIVSLSEEITGRIGALENIVENMFATEYATTAGDGLQLSGDRRLLTVKIGSGLVFEDNGSSSPDEPRAVAVDPGFVPGGDPDNPARAIYLKDESTGDVYRLYVDNGTFKTSMVLQE